MIWEMTVSIWSSPISIWDILSLCSDAGIIWGCKGIQWQALALPRR
jgi:hypothetical protein